MMLKKTLFILTLIAVLICCVSAINAVSNDVLDNVKTEINNDEFISTNVNEHIIDVDNSVGQFSAQSTQNKLNKRNEDSNHNDNNKILNSMDNIEPNNNSDILGIAVDCEDSENDYDSSDVLGASKYTIKTKITVKDITKYYQDGTYIYMLI